ncbi:unnamed protein product [Spirodela intermedia]|uniref:Uncharacterized protein n=1 Tax=Spirodela intermedia TaxID=51605 RepID=A0A7I8J0X7_SPIIN|nr:unnamed protein product [Spirodela intermedia]CAA6663061.1 unnamed protein product [Spirodela intermedia]
MSTLMDTWASGVSKLREKCLPGTAEDEGRRRQPQQQQQQQEALKQKPLRRSTLSEVTVGLLMDRFSPC